MVSPPESGTARLVCARSSLSGSPVPKKITRPKSSLYLLCRAGSPDGMSSLPATSPRCPRHIDARSRRGLASGRILIDAPIEGNANVCEARGQPENALRPVSPCDEREGGVRKSSLICPDARRSLPPDP